MTCVFVSSKYSVSAWRKCLQKQEKLKLLNSTPPSQTQNPVLRIMIYLWSIIGIENYPGRDEEQAMEDRFIITFNLDACSFKNQYHLTFTLQTITVDPGFCGHIHPRIAGIHKYLRNSLKMFMPIIFLLFQALNIS